MTLLDCAVTGCAYNEDRCCCKGNIKVEGSEAVHQNETCCGSFVERGEKNCGCNVKEHESKTIDVACEACNCTFNENKNVARTISASQGATPVPAARQSAQVSAANRRKDGEPEAMQNGSPFCIPVEFPRWNFPLVKCA